MNHGFVFLAVLSAVFGAMGAASAAQTGGAGEVATIRASQSVCEGRVWIVINGILTDVTEQAVFDDGHVFLNGVLVGYLAANGVIYDFSGTPIGLVSGQ